MDEHPYIAANISYLSDYLTPRFTSRIRGYFPSLSKLLRNLSPATKFAAYPSIKPVPASLWNNVAISTFQAEGFMPDKSFFT